MKLKNKTSFRQNNSEKRQNDKMDCEESAELKKKFLALISLSVDSRMLQFAYIIQILVGSTRLL